MRPQEKYPQRLVIADCGVGLGETRIVPKSPQSTFVARAQHKSTNFHRSLAYHGGNAQPMFETVHFQAASRKRGFAEYLHCRIAPVPKYELTAPAGKSAIHYAVVG
jgi:hypothetical protein